MSTPVTVSWELHSPASIQRTWDAFSDTDRFNKLAELGFRFEEHPQPDGTVKRTGKASFLGLDMSWDELPFAWSAPEWFRSERRFHGTPAEKVVTTLRLKAERGGGTSVRYSIAVHPRSALFKPLAQIELSTRTKPKVERALEFLIRELSTEQLVGATPLLGGPPRLSEAAERLLEERCASVGDEDLRARLDLLVRMGSLRDQDRIQPRVQARRWGLETDRVVRGLLDATRAGVLSLRWELICPACKGPATHVDSLGQPDRRVHCSSCNVHFDATFPDSVAVSFRTSSALRDFEVPIECIGSPARQAHVLAQQLALPGEEVEFKLPLDPGAYRLRSWPPRDTAVIEIEESGEGGELRVGLDDEAFDPPRSRHAAGLTSIKVHNAGQAYVQIALERSERSPDLMTAGQLFMVDGARELLPEQAVDPSLTVEAQRGAVVLLSHGESELAQAEADLKRHAPRHTVCGERGSLGTFADAEAALTAARELALRGWPVTLTLGPMLEVQLIGETVPMGAAVDEALAWMALALPRLVLVPEALVEDAELAAAVARAGLSPDPARRPMLRPGQRGALLG
ncbi:MAG: hypothetical protein H6740_20900 [Alphaproteobacteria bacterium]|nr:hypothetical protein [Alphaproteobacteria bacterium]